MSDNEVRCYNIKNTSECEVYVSKGGRGTDSALEKPLDISWREPRGKIFVDHFITLNINVKKTL